MLQYRDYHLVRGRIVHCAPPRKGKLADVSTGWYLLGYCLVSTLMSEVSMSIIKLAVVCQMNKEIKYNNKSRFIVVMD